MGIRRQILVFLSSNSAPHPVVHKLSIQCAETIESETFSCVALYDNLIVQSGAIWSVSSGTQYATIDSTGEVTILSGASSNQITVSCVYNDITATKNITVTYKAGSSSQTETEVVVDPDTGETSTTTTTTTENQDGSSTTSTTIINTDENGDVTGTTESETNVAADGSSTSTTTNYDASGDPVSGSNNTTDVQGNSSTQTVVYDDNGEEVVTGYEIDTSNNPGGGKQFNGDGVNTEYYAFDMTHGFVLDFDFTINFAQQPANQNQNHHNILAMKRADPEPWYGFQLRQSGTNKYIQLGTQFSTGSNTNTQISPSNLENNIGEYSLRIVYDPTKNSNTFVCTNMLTDTVVYSSNYLFPDIEELRYLKVTIGYSMDSNGEPYRYSNINVLNFMIRKLSNIATPTITCDGQQVTIACETSGTSIYYRLGQTGSFAAYTSPITISADTVVEAYAELNGEVSDTASETCLYDNGIERPTISCDGELVTITCDTPSVDIYYRMNQTGNFVLYTEAISINANTVVEAYAELNGEDGPTVTQTCVYSPIVLANPVISCNGSEITITCSTQNAVVYYRLNQTGSYSQYTTAINILEDTTVEAYSQLSGHVSSVVTENCIYSPVHDYSQDYLTFRITTGGTIAWKGVGGGHNKTIQYSINDGSWTSITAATSAPAITVAAGNVVRFKGSNTSYAKDKNNYSGFYEGTAIYNAEGNIMSLIHGDNFANQTTLTSSWALSNLFNHSNLVSAENLVMPATTLTSDCYRATFANSPYLTTAPQLPATTLSTDCYYYMFDNCTSLLNAPELNAASMATKCYLGMFHGCTSLNYIKCLATNPTTGNCSSWVDGVAASGTFVKDANTSWTNGTSGIPNGWTQIADGTIVVAEPVISCDGDSITITCATQGASIYYRLGGNGSYSLYTTPVSISATTTVDAYAELQNETSDTVSQTCEYVSTVPIDASNRTLSTWKYNNQNITTPYSVNAIDGHSSSYVKGTFNFETSVYLRSVQPTYLWFQHADQSAAIYVDNTLVEKHWGGYNAFFVDISNNVHVGSNNIKVALKNNEGSNLAPAAGDFNFNATLGNVKLFTSPVIPSTDYGYDGFHVTTTWNQAHTEATVTVKTSIPIGATVACSISDGTYSFSDEKPSTGEEMSFTATISGNNLHLWHGTQDPHLYTITLNIYKNGDLYHTYERDYGLRYYDYLFNETISVNGVSTNYTGFLLNGEPYYLRGVCMHDDVEGKANALSASDYTQEFSIIQELGCNFIRLAHYPHPKEVYDWCDRLGIIVQTEVPCVNKMQSTMPSAYYDNLDGQYEDMVNQHFNHPSILFWGLSNETTTDDKAFAKTKIEHYASLIKNLDSERWVGYVMSHSYDDPSGYYNNPDVDWFGCNLYVGWYLDQNSNDPSTRLDTRITKTITNLQKPLAYSEYGCGGTQHCHSDDFMTTTTRGNNARHDIEYQMWLHEGHIAALRNYPQLLFTGQWQLFDIAVANRNEGYTVCLDGENATTDDNLRRLNNKGLVERDHVTKKDTFYLYKAEWNTTPFVHICGKDYTKKTGRSIKCYSNDGGTLSLYVNNQLTDTATVTNNIAVFASRNFNSGDVIRVDGANATDTFTFAI